MPFLILFFVSWASFLLFADWKKWRTYAPVSLLAMVMSLASDQLVSLYPLWTYHDPFWGVPSSIIRFLDDIGVYPVTAYLFVQHVPRQNATRRWLYFFAWTSGGIALEILLCTGGWMIHHDGWSTWCSYFADWLIFYILYRFVRLLQEVRPAKQTDDVLEVMKQHGLNLSFLDERNQADVMLLEIEPGSKVGAHTHSGDEFAILLQGQLEVSVGPERQVVTSGQWVNIKSQVVHSAVNNDSREVALVLSIVLASGLQQKLRAHTLDQLLLSTEPLRL